MALREHHRFMRGLSAWVGFRQEAVRYERAERFAGTTKYPLRKMLRFSLDAITGFSYVPLQLATTLGFVLAGISLLAIVVAAVRLTTAPLSARPDPDSGAAAGWYPAYLPWHHRRIPGPHLRRGAGPPLYIVRDVLEAEERH